MVSEMIMRVQKIYATSGTDGSVKINNNFGSDVRLRCRLFRMWTNLRVWHSMVHQLRALKCVQLEQ